MLKRCSLVTALAVLALAGCSANQPTAPAAQTTLSVAKATIAASTLTVAVADGLAFMREEEKLAHDVYLRLGQRWRVSLFTNIADSEQRHTDAVRVLLERYGLPDPAAGNGVGEFENAELQSLYDALLARGLTSLREAALVGKLIEETDIADLDAQLALVAAGTDIATVYQNLRDGSVSHLAAFESFLSRLR